MLIRWSLPFARHDFSLAIGIKLGVVWLMLLCVLSVTMAQAEPSPPEKFIVFDATQYKNKPDLSQYGIRPATLLSTGMLWHKEESLDQPPAPLHVWDAARVNRSRSDLLILDVENWPLRGDEATVAASLSKYLKLLEVFRSHAPGKSIGYYGLPVGRDFWRAIEGAESAKYKAWQKENDAVTELAAALDVSLPSLYTFYPDQPGWVNYAVANIAEARRISPGKPVYAFLWPKFHDSNKLLRGTPIPGDFWKLQLETVRLHADGVVIWGGWGEDGTWAPAQWQEEAEWWKITKDFIKTIQ